jgi:diguanylate cyclase (GGDEF)-like protein/PAS domain S-box-containing protein
MTEAGKDKPRILVVDDVTENIHALINILRDHHAVIAATSGAKALELAARPPRPDLILLDIRMPDMDGYEVLRRLKTDPATAEIPVIFVTALSESADEARGLDLGAADYITKPVNPDLLKWRILTQLELRRYRAKRILPDVSAEESKPGGLSILVVDDMPENVHGLIGALSEQYRISVATDGQAAIDSVDGADPPDLILLDVVMPEMDGYEVCRRIKAMETGNHIPVIFLSVLGESIDRVRGFALGGADFISKPFDIDEARARIRTHIQLNRLRLSFEQQLDQRTAALRATAGQLRATLEAIPDLLFEIDASGHCWDVHVPRGGLWSPQDLLGRNIAEVLPPAAVDAYLAAIGEANGSGHSNGRQFELARPEGNLWFELSVSRKTAASPEARFIVLSRDITERKAAEEKIQRLAFSDPLTELPNRRLLLDRLHHALATCARSKRYGVLMLIDLDNFKVLNDTLGHDVGDRLLQQVALRLRKCVREGDTVARLGGDEFVVMLEDLADSAQEAATGARTVGEKVLAALSKTFQLADYEVHSTPSIGIALFGNGESSVDNLFKQTDLAMYQAKAAGRSTLRFFDPEMQAAVSSRATLETDLRQAIWQKQFLLHYQPQVDVAGRWIGVEALVRWRHPMRGMVSPAEFIPLAEETGLILPLGYWVLEAACRQLVAWSAQPGLRELTMAVNVSARQFSLPDFVSELLALIEHTGADPQRLKLEFTESLLLENAAGTIDKMLALKARGIGFSLDDFGTGYSSLSYLKRLPLDQLKIDQSFVRDVLTDPNDAAIAKTIVALAQSLGLKAIAEGVETEEQRDFLAGNGCLSYQGYFFSRPLPAEAIEAFVLGGDSR